MSDQSNEPESSGDERLERLPGPSRRGFLTRTAALGGLAAGLDPLPALADEKPTRKEAAVNPRLFTFVGGKAGGWTVVSARAIVGDTLPAVERLDIVNTAVPVLPDGAKWILRGVTSNERYATRAEKELLVKKQVALGRATALHAAL